MSTSKTKISTKKKKKFIFWAFLLWTLWVCFYATVMYYQIPELQFFSALISSANYNYVYATLSILIWIVCKKTSFERTHKVLFVCLHFFLAMFFSVVWLAIVYGLWYLVEGKIIFEMIQFRNIVGWQFTFGVVNYILIAGIFYTIIYYRNFKQKELNEVELKILTRDAELKALKLQMNPHFLFNSLNSVNALVTKNSNLARKMISQLSELLRMSLESHDKLKIPLQEELKLVHTYLSIEQTRFENKMKYDEKIDMELLSRPFPAMLLQPLIENAVKHGIVASRGGGSIELSIQKSNTHIIGKIANTIEQKNFITEANQLNGISFSNIKERLNRMYGENYDWQIDNSEKNCYKVIFKIPIE